MGGAFFGESMFSLEPDASKVCLVHLVGLLKDRGFALLDSQIINEHIRRFGGVEIPREEYLLRLTKALDRETRFP
jgi:leucyl/phenylalanyl-tRNA--protein transferase